MRLNTLSPAAGSRTAKKRVGRGIGSGSGKTCGLGTKGQKARSGGKVRRGFEGGQMPLQRRLPKFGFFGHKAKITGEVRLSELDRLNEVEIDVNVLKRANVVQSGIKYVKVICTGQINRAVTLKGLGATRSARDAIEKAGGRIEA